MTIDDIRNQDWDNFDEEKHQEELYSNIASLAEQNNLLGETLKMIVVEIALTEHIAHAVLNDNIEIVNKYMKENLMADLRACVDEVAKDYAEFESEKLKNSWMQHSNDTTPLSTRCMSGGHVPKENDKT